MSKKVCKAHRRSNCSTCKAEDSRRGDSSTDSTLWTTVYGSSYDSGSYDSGSSSSCGSGGGE